MDRGKGRSGRCHRGGGSDVFIRGARPDAALPASSGRVLSSSQGPWGSQVVTPIYRQMESEEQWALRLGPEHRQVASGTLVSRRAQPREGRTQDGLWPRRPRLSSPPERGVPRSPLSPRVPPEAQTAGLTCPGPRAWHTPDLSLSLGLDNGQR